MPQLRIKNGEDAGKIFDLSKGAVRLGRDANCLARLNDAGVSREHAEIYHIGEMYFIRDLDSRNGTVVNDIAVLDELLREGDLIRICNTNMVFEDSSQRGKVDLSEEQEDSFYASENENENETDPSSTLSIKVEDSGENSSLTKNYLLGLKKFQRETAEESDLQSVFERALDLIFSALDIQEAFVFTLEQNKLKQKTHRHVKAGEKGRASKSIVLRALRERSSVMTSNARSDFRFKSEQSVVMNKISSVLCVPLLALGREYGVIYLSSSIHQAHFSSEAVEFVGLIANQTALAYSSMEYYHRSRAARLSNSLMLMHLVEEVCPQLQGRGERVSRFVRVLAKQLELKTRTVTALISAARLHHVGYIKTGSRQMTEDFLMNDPLFVEASVEILKDHGGYGDILDFVHFQRAKLDGSGYPSVIDPNQWSQDAQVLSLAVELELRIHLPMIFEKSLSSIGEIVESIGGRSNHYSPELLDALGRAYQAEQI